jgi:hypothetical protein
MTRVSAFIAPILALVAALLLAALPMSAQGAAQEPIRTAIGVRVLNEAGHIVPGAEVILLTADGKKLAMRRTNLEGRAIFAPVKPGDYIVRAHKLGQGRGQEHVTAEEGKLTRVTIHLKKA